MEEINKVLTKSMGDCYHEFEKLTDSEGDRGFICDICEESFNGDVGEIKVRTRNDFLTWEGFGLLFEWAKEQYWFCEFLYCNGMTPEMDMGDLLQLVDPENFAKAVIDFQDREKK